jgi:uncharacterized membrane protein
MANQWSIGFDDTGRPAQVQDVITRLGWEKHQLILRDLAVAISDCDGSFTLNGEPFAAVTTTHCGKAAHCLAGLAPGAPPLTGAAVGGMLATIGATTEGVGISDNFDRDVEGLMKPATSALFFLDEGGDMDSILYARRGPGGTALRTNAELERAKLIQSTLAASAATTQPNGQ